MGHRLTSPMPVFPPVPSTIVSPGFSSPSFSACTGTRAQGRTGVQQLPCVKKHTHVHTRRVLWPVVTRTRRGLQRCAVCPARCPRLQSTRHDTTNHDTRHTTTRHDTQNIPRGDGTASLLHCWAIVVHTLAYALQYCWAHTWMIIRRAGRSLTEPPGFCKSTSLCKTGSRGLVLCAWTATHTHKAGMHVVVGRG